MANNQLKDCLKSAAFAFRGFNVTNVGRSSELLAHPAYGPVVAEYLGQASQVCADVTGREIDLVGRVRANQETTLATYDETISLILGMQTAQLRLLEQFFDICYAEASLAYGYSLGEVGALVASGVFPMSSGLTVIISLAKDCAELAADVTLGILFSRGPELPLDEVNRLCLRINSDGCGVIGISSYLSPNSLLLLGQGDTVDRFKERMKDVGDDRIYLRKNQHRWPPLHTPIVWERHVPNRSSLLMHTMKGGFAAPVPPVLSLVTGKTSYNDYNTREILSRWTDHPQRLWDAVYETLARGIETVIHVGPQPNLIPATFKRLSDNVEAQTRGSIGIRAVQGIASRPWLKALLPSRTALLRAPLVKHVVLEDWLLEQDVS